MIFASVGSMLPFDRLVRAVDVWACDNPGEDVFLQIGDTPYEPRHAPFARIMPMSAYRERLRACDLFVAHAGMGSILQALEERKQMLMLPRHQSRGEHTTDHQLHTTANLGDRPGLKVVDDTAALQSEMTAMLARPIPLGDALPDHAPEPLLAGIRSFLSSVRAADT